MKNPNVKRLAKRKQDREIVALQQEWDKTVTPFHNELFSSTTSGGYSVFQKYNEVWIETCNRLNKGFKLIKADPKLFYDYAINQDTSRFDEKV